MDTWGNMNPACIMILYIFWVPDTFTINIAKVSKMRKKGLSFIKEAERVCVG
jgi:hypothetical protein